MSWLRELILSWQGPGGGVGQGSGAGWWGVVKGGAQGKGNAGSVAAGGGQGGRWPSVVVGGRDARGAAVVADGGGVGWWLQVVRGRWYGRPGAGLGGAGAAP